jgi:hypothetical protein
MPELHMTHRMTDGPEDLVVTATARQIWTFAAVWVGLILLPGLLCIAGVLWLLMGWRP